MRTERSIRNQLAHMRDGCSGDPAVNAVWIQALEWVLSEPDIRVDHTPEQVLEAAVHCLRSYQYGNSSPELAEEVADAIDAYLTMWATRSAGIEFRGNPPVPTCPKHPDGFNADCAACRAAREEMSRITRAVTPTPADRQAGTTEPPSSDPAAE